MLESGTKLGRYEIVRLLGKGGWGEVYEAHDSQLDRRIALKLLPREHAVDPDLRTRFEREARTVAALDHPNIVTIHSVEESDGMHFITMQLVRGRTLDKMISRGGMPLRRLFELAIPLADAIASAHARDIVHRDLKPQNVMVTDDGQLKVLDFGLAKLMPTSDETLGSVTADGAVLGTLAYMSPEQLRGEEADRRSDIFALGIMLYEMSTGRAPFKGKSSVEVAASILRDRPSGVEVVKAGLPRHLGRIIRVCLEEDPDKRFQSAVDVRNQLDQLRTELETGEIAVVRDAMPRARPNRARLAAAAAGLALLLAAGGYLFTRQRPPEPAPVDVTTAEATRIVVLPFRNLGEPEVAYLASGITEEISSRLAGLDGLGVISRISADQYEGTNKTTHQIGRELGVSYILQGTLQWAANGSGASQVRIMPKLIRVADDTQIWAQPYDRSLEDIFEVQSEIAANVAESLGTRLISGRTTAGEEAPPTANVEAYQAYLRGLHYESRPVYTIDNWEQAVVGFEEAVRLDPDFALAWARLGRSHAFIHHLNLDLSPERSARAREAIERAAELAPDDPEVRLALGYYHYEVDNDYDLALTEFAFAESRLADHVEVHEGKGYVLRRQGRWPEALSSLNRAFRLNPRDAALAAEIGETYANIRDYAQALQWYDQSITLDPDQVWAYFAKTSALWLQGADLSAARQTLSRMPRSQDSLSTWAWFWQEVFEGRPQQALERLPEEPGHWLEYSEWSLPAALLAAQAAELLDDAAGARASYVEASRLLTARLEVQPDDPRLHSALGLAYAGLGRNRDAWHHGKTAVRLQPISADAFSGATFVAELALIYALSGRPQEAIEQLEYLLARPALVSASLLRLDPRWRSLRDDPRFQSLIADERGVAVETTDL